MIGQEIVAVVPHLEILESEDALQALIKRTRTGLSS